MTKQDDGANHFSTLHPDIVNSHILTRVDGTALASAACSSATLRRLSSSDDLWSRTCHSTWPSTAAPPLRDLISTFPAGGPRAFFSQAYPIVTYRTPSSSSTPISELISAVDIHYKDKLVFTKTQTTETSTDWFQCSPFRIDLLEPKDAVPAPTIKRIGDIVAGMIDDMTLSWILIDPAGRRAANLSSHRAVAAQQHWLTGEVRVRYGSILAGDHRDRLVQCGMVVTCGECEGGGMQVKEVSMEMEDVDGVHLNGKESLVFLQGALEGKRGTGRNRVEEGRRRYKEYVEMRRERRERTLRTEGVLDVLCVVFGGSVFVSFCYFFFQ